MWWIEDVEVVSESDMTKMERINSCRESAKDENVCGHDKEVNASDDITDNERENHDNDN